MQQIMCFEVLMATVFLWVAVFGLTDIVREHIPKLWQQALMYVVVGVGVLVFLATHKQVNVCMLM